MSTRKHTGTLWIAFVGAVTVAISLVGCAARAPRAPGDLVLADQLGDMASDIDPAQVYIDLGTEYFNARRYAESIDQFRNAIEINPYADEAHAGMGMSYYRLGRRADAERAFRAALRLNERNVLARSGLAMVSEDQQERTTQLEAAIVFSPDAPELRNNLCYFLAESGDYDRAVEECRESIRLDSTNHIAHYNLGYAYQRQGRLDQALVHYEIARRIDPNWARVHNNIGLVYFYKSRFSDAILAYETAIAADGTEAIYRYNLALAYEALAHRLFTAEREGIRTPEDYGSEGEMSWRILYRRAADELRSYLDIQPNAPNADRIRAKINELRRRAS